MENYYTSIIYSSNLINVVEENEYKSMIALDDIKSQTLLFIEHVFTGAVLECQIMVRENEYFYDQLYPREKIWEKEEKHKNKYAMDKVARNCIGRDCNNIIIGDLSFSCTE